MAMDDTDKRLVNGTIYLVVLLALLYYIPSYGYQDLKKKEAEARNRLEQKKTSYDRYYPPMSPVNFGEFTSEASSPPRGMYMEDLKQLYQVSTKEIQQLIDLKEQSSRMQFPPWSVVPETEKREPGVYFQLMWQRKRNVLESRWHEAGVECLDSDVGFSKYRGIVNIPLNEAEELLRKLCIAEKVIELCMTAKVREEAEERKLGVLPEAFMKIIKVEPSPSVPTGPSALIPNPKYSPEEKNPNSDRFRKYNVRLWKSFIQEYPVEIKLQCDVNTFMRFLHSVRQTGQFLVIRNLEIISPFLQESLEDRSEFNGFNPENEKDSKEKVDVTKKLTLRDEHILVKISAAGMDFFDPVQHPRGLYDKGVKSTKPVITKKRFKIEDGQ